MVKTLRITGVIVVLLALAIFSVPVIYGVKTDETAENYINGPELIDIFNANSGNRPAAPTNQDHPLVSQAKIFKNIIDPPPPVKPKITTNTKTTGRPNIPTPTTVTPKFELISTSYYEANPELSMALIQEVGKKERTWVMQSSIVNHLTIEQVKDGSVIVRNGEETFEKTVPEKNFASPNIPKPSPDRRTSASPRTAPAARPAPTNRNSTTTAPAARPPRQPASKTSKTTSPDIQNEEERMQKVEDLFAKMRMISESEVDSGDSEADMEQKAVLMQKLITDFKKSNMDISEEESEKLMELGEQLEDFQDPKIGK